MPESQLQALMEKREIVLEELSKIFDEVLLDLRTRQEQHKTRQRNMIIRKATL